MPQTSTVLSSVSINYLILIIIFLSFVCTGSLGIIGFFIKRTLDAFQIALDKFSSSIDRLAASHSKYKDEVEAKFERGTEEFRDLDVRLVKQETTCKLHQEERREGHDRRINLNDIK
jgi:hypothetical protein